jgi:dolichol-phosphate mannosyltransferase
MTIAVVIPCYRVSKHILGVLARIPEQVALVLVVDDACPEHSGKVVEEACRDPRVLVHFNEKNLGVGGATIEGYKQAIKYGADIVVKLDGDGQMNPEMIPELVAPILDQEADYVKGNRFFDLQYLHRMPTIRLLGNLGVSFVSKFSSGYWSVMDPANGFTAIHARVIELLPLNSIDKGYFFESDMLYRLGLLQAVVKSLPMAPVYGNEESNLSVARVSLTFPGKYMARFWKRLFYSYFFRDFNAGSVFLLSGFLLTLVGMTFGGYHWYKSIVTGIPATSGTVMLAALPLVLAFQSLLAAMQFDIAAQPKQPIHPRLSQKRKRASVVQKRKAQ